MIKKIVLLLIAISSFISCTSTEKFTSKKKHIDQHNSYNSLDWEGTYIGLEPCDNDKYIMKRISLFEDLTYELYFEYFCTDKPLIEKYTGKLRWIENGSVLELISQESSHFNVYKYKVGENILMPLDSDGNSIEYKDEKIEYPKKSQSNKIFRKKWSLLELYGNSVGIDTNSNQKQPNIRFDTAGFINGNAGCNDYSGSFKFNDNQLINIENIVITKKYCPDMYIEDRFIKILSEKFQYEIEQDTLIFRSSDNHYNILAKFLSK